MPTGNEFRMIDNKIGIAVVTDEKELTALRNFVQSLPPAPRIKLQKPQKDEIIADYIARYVNKEASALPGIIEILQGTDVEQKKRLLYAINDIRKNIDVNFQITSPELIGALFHLVKYKSLEWPLIDLLTTYRPTGYTLVLKKWLTNRRVGVISNILYHLVYMGEYDSLCIVEKLTTRRRADLVQWPLILITLKGINEHYGTVVAPYIQAIVMQLFRHKIISMEGVQRDRMKEFQMHYLHFLCLYGTTETDAYMEEVTPLLQRDYLAYYRYRKGITTDLTEIFSTMQGHEWYATYRDFGKNVRGYMTEEWKIYMMQYFLRKMRDGGDHHHLPGSEALCHSVCGPDFINNHISLIEEPDTANCLLKLHTIRSLPAEIILSDMLNVGFLQDIPRASALGLISDAQRNAPQALFGYIREQLPGKFTRDHYTGVVSDAVYLRQHILQWAADCGPILDDLSVHVEEDEERNTFGRVKAVFRDRGYILKSLTYPNMYDLDLVKVLLNTLLEYANISERLVELSSHGQHCFILGDVKKLRALAAKYDYTTSA